MGAFTRDLKTIQPDIDRVFTLFPRLKERIGQVGGTLSGGEQQMLAIGRALMSAPRVLLLDEPSLGLAPILVQQVFQTIREINKQGTTILLVEQNALQALSIANRGYVLQTGEVRLTGPADELIRNEMVRKAYLEKSRPDAPPPRAARTASAGTADDRRRRAGRPAGGPIRFEAAIGRTSRTPVVVAAVIGLFVGVALVKPWEVVTAPAEPQSASTSPNAAAIEPRPRARASDSARCYRCRRPAMCLNAFSWRTATIEQWDHDQTVRVWRALDPHGASGPTDPGIDAGGGETVPAIGYCAPAFGPESPVGPAEVVAWRVAGGIATPVALRQVAPIGVVSALGALFGPPDRGASWPAGTYVFRHAMVDVEDADLWFAVEVRTDGQRRFGAVLGQPPPSAVMQPGGGRGAFFLP